MIFMMGSIIIAFIAMVNYRKGFLLYLLFQMIWFPDTQVFKIGDSSVNINFLMAVFFVSLFIIKHRGIKRLGDERFPYKVPMICIMFSLFITCFSSLAGFLSEFTKAFGIVIMDILIVYLIWKVVKTKEDFVFLFKGLTIIVFIACLYCLFEASFHLNPILDYKFSYASGKLAPYTDYIYGWGRGYRCSSIFEHPICASMIFALYAALGLIFIIKKIDLPYNKLVFFTVVLSIICIFLTKQRAGMFFFALAILPCVDLKKKRFYKFVIIGVICCLLILPIISDYLFVLISTFVPSINNGVGGTVGGSNVPMRLMQLNAVYNIMLQSPIAGLGENFKRFYSSAYAEQALDFESLWFEQMAKHGLFGVISYIIMIYYSIVIVPKKYKSKTLFFISLAYWLTYTLTSTPYFRIYFYYVVIFYFIRNSKVYTTVKRRQTHTKKKYHFHVVEKTISGNMSSIESEIKKTLP